MTTRAKSADQQMRERLAKEGKARNTQTQRRAAPAVSPEEMKDAFADLSSIDILDRRLTNPDTETVLPIRLKDEPTHVADPHGHKRKWYLRWFNTTIPNRFHNATAALGYVPVLWDELQDREIVANAFTSGDQVRRGDRGVEVLCKMPMVYYKQIKAKQREKANRAMTPKALREQIRHDAAKRGLDPDLDDSVGGIVGDIKVGRDRVVNRDDEATAEELI